MAQLLVHVQFSIYQVVQIQSVSFSSGVLLNDSYESLPSYCSSFLPWFSCLHWFVCYQRVIVRELLLRLSHLFELSWHDSERTLSRKIWTWFSLFSRRKRYLAFGRHVSLQYFIPLLFVRVLFAWRLRSCWNLSRLAMICFDSFMRCLRTLCTARNCLHEWTEI